MNRQLITQYTQDSNRRLPALLALQARQQRRIAELRTGRAVSQKEYVALRDVLKGLLLRSNQVQRAISMKSEAYDSARI
jgi:hypothetical protein